MATLSLAAVVLSGCSDKPGTQGLAYSGETRAENVCLLVDETWVDEGGNQHVNQEIFDSVFAIIDEAEQFVLLDYFLVNEFLYQPAPGMRHLSQELADRLVAKRKSHPEVEIIFITDPVNTVYGSIPSPQFQELEKAGVTVVWTELDKLRDSNPIISKPWRLLAKPWGLGPGDAVQNPMGVGRVSLRSMLKLLNFKANHRKVLVTEKSLLVTSANPHSASSAHWNVALRVDGAGMAMACEAESAILRMSGAEAFPRRSGALTAPPMEQPSGGECDEGIASTKKMTEGSRLELLTERKIKDKILALLAAAEPDVRIDLSMFYLSDRDVIKALIGARKAGADVRVILDPAKDAFGRIKNGIPNRQSAARLVKAGIPLRWANTHGEQCHVKMLYVEHADQTATLLLGSCNYTRRNMDNYNCECDLAFTAPLGEASMQRTREVFDRWWKNPGGRDYTVAYETFEDSSIRRRFRAWLMETTGLCTF
jgi:phosphatidylserine/phosphatidylglycerophosphate/cardiolipin synthase-like enzyme